MTQVDDSTQTEAEVVPVVSGPGRQLREAREAQKLTVGQVAAQLRMQLRIIEALESDDYSTLPGATFVQGYLRSYSRLLGLPEESILALAQADRGAEPILLSSIDGGPDEASSKDLPFRAMSLLVLVVMVVGIGWWLSQHQPLTDALSLPPATPQGEQGLALPDETIMLQEEVIESASTPSEGESAEESETAMASDKAETDEAETAAVETTPPPAAVTPPRALAPDVAAPELTAAVPQSTIELNYQADSWSEITDAAGRKLTYGLIPAGSNLKLSGEAPFKVFLGFAPGVTIYYNGELYEHSPYQRGDVARFRIGRAEHNLPVSGN